MKSLDIEPVTEASDLSLASQSGSIVALSTAFMLATKASLWQHAGEIFYHLMWINRFVS